MTREAQAILLIPGLNCTPRLYAAQMPALWAFGPVTVADHRRGESMDAIAGQILADAPPRFALAGLSMGGYLALAILRLAPERVTRLALLDTGARADTPEARARRKAAIAATQAGRFDTVNAALWPVLVHKERQGDAALKEVVLEMGRMSVPTPSCASSGRSWDGRTRAPTCRPSPARRSSWSATATSSPRPSLRRRWRT